MQISCINNKNITEKERELHFIIPVYNTLPFLTEIKDTLSNQTSNNFTVLFVDDGSTDGSGDFLDSLQNQQDSIEVIHKNNYGLGAARNTGLDFLRNKGVSNDDYILFLDSDDLLSPETVEKIIAVLHKEPVDILEFQAELFFENSQAKQQLAIHDPYMFEFIKMHGDYSKVRTGIDYLANINPADFKTTATTKAYNAGYLFKNELYFPEGILHEDILFSFLTMLHAKSVRCLHENLYKIRIRANSIMSNNRSWNNIKGRFHSVLKAIEELNNYNLPLSETQQDALSTFIEDWTISNYEDYKKINKEEIKQGLMSDFSYGDQWVFKKILIPRREYERSCKVIEETQNKIKDLDKQIEVLHEQITNIYKSTTWKVGNCLVRPLKKLLHFIKQEKP